MAEGRMNARDCLTALNDWRQFDLSPPMIAGIARSDTAAVRDWLSGCAIPPEPVALRLRAAVVALNGLTRTVTQAKGESETLALSALAARHSTRLVLARSNVCRQLAVETSP